MVSQLFRRVCQIIGINAYAVPANKARFEAQCIPLSIHPCQHFIRINMHPITYHCNFIHKGYVYIPLAVFHNLYRLGRFYTGHHKSSRFNHNIIYFFNLLSGFFIHAGNNFYNIGKPVYVIARIYSLRAVSNLPIHSTLKSRFLFNDRYTDIFCHTWIHRGFKNHNGSRREILSNGTGCPLNGLQVRSGIGIDRCRHSHNDKFCFL